MKSKLQKQKEALARRAADVQRWKAHPIPAHAVGAERVSLVAFYRGKAERAERDCAALAAKIGGRS